MSEVHRIKWVIVEVGQVDGANAVFVEPYTLSIPYGWIGTIVWYAFTPGWVIESITFDANSVFTGDPQPDPARPGCWTTAVTNDEAGQCRYTVVTRNEQSGDRVSHDPVVENEAPPTSVLSLRRASNA